MTAGAGVIGRVFGALVPPAEIKAAMVERLAGWHLPGRPVSVGNWHLTLRFVGSVDVVRYELWLAGLDQSDLGPPLRLRLGGIGTFPRPARAAVVWSAVEGEGLGELAAVVEQATVGAGIAPEERPFQPHLTLARARPPVDARPLLATAAPLNLAWRATEVVVLRSLLGRGEARYEPLERFPLG